MNRRRLLLASLGVGAGALSTSGEPVRQLLDVILASETRSIEDWNLACTDHLFALRTRPPAQVRQDLIIDLIAAQRQLKTIKDGDRPEMHRVIAALSTLQANTLTRLGEHGAAIRWWHTARTAADASRDLAVQLMVRCEEAGFGLYGQRDLSTVLRLVSAAERLAGDSPSFWKADLAGTRAKALSRLGRPQEAEQALNTFAEWDGGDGRAAFFPMAWNYNQVQFAQSWVYAGAGKESQADEAREKVLAHNRPGDYVYKTNVQLHRALCTVTKGGTEEGARQAAQALDSLPTPHRNHLITETGKAVLRAIPTDQRENPAVQEFREVLATTAPPTPTPA